MLDDRPYTLDRIVRLAFVLAILIGLVKLTAHLSDVLIPFAIALIAAYLLHPLASFLEAKFKNRTAAVLATLGLSLSALIGIFALTAPMLTDEVRHMSRLLAELVNHSDLSQRAAEHLPPDIWQALRDFASRPDVKEIFKSPDAISLFKTLASKALPGIWGVVRGAAGLVAAITGLAVIVLYIIFLLMDFEALSNSWTRALPPSTRSFVQQLSDDFGAAMGRYFRAQALVAASVGVLFAIGFALIGMPLGILLGLSIGVLNMVPYLQMLGLIPAFLLASVHAIESGTGMFAMLGLTASVFVIVQVIQDAVLVPRIMGKAMGLSPALILLSLSIWGKLLGMLGLLIAIPMTCLLWAWYQRYVTQE